MNKLKKKTFILLFSLLSVFLFSILFIYNVVLYKNEYDDISNLLFKLETAHNNFSFKKELPGDKRPIFINSNVYVVSFDTNMDILDITNYSDSEMDYEKIKSLAIKYVKNNNKNIKLSNLYFNKYSYLYRNNNLMIIDNSEVSSRLIFILLLSICLFLVLEVIILLIVNKITKWLIMPVEDTFNKQKQFICDASHELKTPLSIIIASAETLQDNPKEKKWINTIQNEAERMNKLVVDLLELARSEKENTEAFNSHNLSKIVENSSLTFESIIFEKGLELNLEIESNIKYACSPDKIKQLLGILLDNAIKHSLDNAKITVLLKKDNNNIILEVINRGEEIPKDMRDKIFERFYRVDASRNRNDNRYGLGLAIAKNIVINHKGSILVNCENGYTTFRVIFKQK